MNTCSTCGYRIISNKLFQKHLDTHVTPEVAPPVEEVKPEEKVFDVAQPVVDIPEPVKMVYTDEITIRFSKDIEIRINGVGYTGKVITVKDMSIASEIVRIAREAYGPQILL